ncbi:pyridoxal-phosphate dependent enzyme [Niabella beijingensis]|uniref:pyridoxal-phosphate dependent enzyme n=1 Tax=Niabella beijingensis TaxID=2872700 RepID=UPI001CBF6BBD|nr:pyridoxal-phosphate dependent enzyme [Niabella beijingensis]MBZ4191395.1 pyridoxal-phosphate dependent enzyme [Niabella beijingensis]
MKGIWKYKSLLPEIGAAHRITLGEGNTPLIRARNIGDLLGLKALYFKLEQLNPTGSYKDRFAAVAVSDLYRRKVPFFLATSSGNTGAALAAYGAASDIRCFLSIVDGAPAGKIRQMGIYGADIFMIKKFGISRSVTENVMQQLRKLATQFRTNVEISAYCYSPVGMSGVETIAFEIAEALPQVQHVFVPAGGGGLTLAVIKGFEKWRKLHTGFYRPSVFCVQPEGNDTIAGALETDLQLPQGLAKSTTSISGLQVPNILDGNRIILKARSGKIKGAVVTDADVYECQKQLAQLEGIYCEPAGAVALAGLKKALISGTIRQTDKVVCLVTGHGFKDPLSGNRIFSGDTCKYFNRTAESISHIKNSVLDS